MYQSSNSISTLHSACAFYSTIIWSAMNCFAFWCQSVASLPPTCACSQLRPCDTTRSVCEEMISLGRKNIYQYVVWKYYVCMCVGCVVCLCARLQPVAVLRTKRNTNRGVCDVCLCVRLQQFAALRYNKLCMRTKKMRIMVSLVADIVWVCWCVRVCGSLCDGVCECVHV